MSEVAKQWWPSTIYAAPEETIEPLHIIWINKSGSADPYVTVTLADTLQYSYDNANWVNASSADISGNQMDGGSQYHVYIRRRPDLEPITTLFSLPTLNNKWTINGGQARISGNIMSLLGQDEEVESNAFAALFGQNSNLIDASGLEMPAMTLAPLCYSGMFLGCTALTAGPALPAMTLNDSCYKEMFSGCAALTTAPALPATELKRRCYYSMFYGCSALTAASALPAMTLAESCYENMFLGCTTLTTAPALPATTLADRCYASMFTNCSALTDIPALPAMEMKAHCYDSMFASCTSLTDIPAGALPAMTLADSCYYSMFQHSSAAPSADLLPATVMAPFCYAAMFAYDDNITTVPNLPATVMAEACYESMFSTCGGILGGATLNAAVLVTRCCRRMFQYCGGLESVDFTSATNISAEEALDQWLRGTAEASGGTLYVSSAMLKNWKKDGEVPNNWSIVAR